MKSRTRVFSALFAVVAVPLLLTSCTPQANPNAIGSVSQGKGITAAPAANGKISAPSATPSASATQKSDTTVLSNDNIVKMANEQFPGIMATKKHSQAEVLKALYSARFALDDLQTRPVFLDGDWATNGYSANDLIPVSSYFATKASAALFKSAAAIDTKQQARGDLLLLTSYFPQPADGYAVCPAKKACSVEGYPAYTNVRYGDAKDGGVYVQFDVEDRYVATHDGAKGYMPITKTIKLSMVPNSDYSTDLGNLPYMINGWSGSYERGSFAQ